MHHIVTDQGTLRGFRKLSFMLGALLALCFVAFGAVGNSASAHTISGRDAAKYLRSVPGHADGHATFVVLSHVQINIQNCNSKASHKSATFTKCIFLQKNVSKHGHKKHGHKKANSPNGSGAQKVPLTTNNISCNGTPASDTGNGSGTGFVIFNKTPSGMLIANVVLQHAAPKATYDVRLIATPNNLSAPCPGPIPGVIATGQIITDAQGDGSVNIHLTAPDAKDAFAVLNNHAAPGEDFYTTKEVFFTSPAE